MFERLDDDARGVLALAQDEARALHSSEIADEHLLAGVARQGQGVGARALQAAGVSLAALRAQIALSGGPSNGGPGAPPLSAAAKRTLEGSLREADRLGDRGIGTGHLLLALVRKPEGAAAEILVSLGVDLNQLEVAVRSNLDLNRPDVVASPRRSGHLSASRPVAIRLSGWRWLWYRRIVRLPGVFYPLAWFNCSVPVTRGRLDRLMDPREVIELRRRRRG